MSRYRIDLEYEGTRYRGWQEQKNARTVAGELRRALEARHGPVADLGGAGRTDAGVHALHQVAHLSIAGSPEPEKLLRDVNLELAHDVNVLAVARAHDRFHARHAADSRSYVYQIARRRTAFGKRHVWWVEAELDVARMREAARALVGRHDFALLSDLPKEPKSTVVEVRRAEIGEDGDLVLVRVEASHFLWKMVRRIVGALVQVGRGALESDEFAGLVAGRPLDPARGKVSEWTAAPSGLFLESVRYPGDPPLLPLAPAAPLPQRPPAIR